MVEIIEILRQEHRNIEKLLVAMEQELSVFDRGERPDYEVFGAIIEFFKMYPDTCHHPKEDIIYEKFKVRDPDRVPQLQTFRLSIEKVQCGCAVSVKLSTLFSTIRNFYVTGSVGSFATLSTTKEDISL
jgi:hemerythrin-like domain-containing protein